MELLENYLNFYLIFLSSNRFQRAVLPNGVSTFRTVRPTSGVPQCSVLIRSSFVPYFYK